MGAEDRGLLSFFNLFSRPADTVALSAAHSDRRVFLVVVEDDDVPEAALRFAARRARRTGGRVALFTSVEAPEFQHWMFVGNLMQDEARTEAEDRLQRHAATVHALSGEHPEIMVGEGPLREALCDLVAADQGISVLVVNAATGDGSPSDLVASLTGKYAGRLRVPVTIVPPNLAADEIDGLT